jgi:hypothetical protein
MNVLADRHHSGLYHSLQLLAERLGWTLHTPIGIEWWDADYWAFGKSTYNDDRLAQQFLVGVAGPDGLGTPPDGEFPDWPINEPGLGRFADAMGARFIVQVGNTGQYVDWRRDPLVLSSSEMPLYGRGLTYHQEMDPIAYHPPKHRGTAASFVNCMPFMGSCWTLLQEAQGIGLPVQVHGIDGPDGIIKPNTALVQLMAAVDWGWHDKAQGDGFGHVIHTWAAVGRPLIGHASHYKGKMGERFWKDGVTCIDLDQHSIAETVEMVRKMCACRHRDMSMAIRAEFDEIDYDAEAEQIRALLA